MLLVLENLLLPEDLQYIESLIADARFAPGVDTAGWHAKLVKNNQQMEPGDAEKKIHQVILNRLRGNDLFNMAAMPMALAPFLVTKTGVGQEYGPHVDDPTMGSSPPLRTDISMTVFLSDPQEYAGGELVMDESSGSRAIRLPKGCAVFYPSTTLHHVAPVTEGQRLVALTWIQSHVRKAEQREVLFDLDTARRAIFSKDGKTREFDLISKSHANLMRAWMGA